MTKVAAGITTSLDGYVAGPNDGPDRGLGEGGERLHYWVFGGAWSYDEEPRGEATGADKEFLDWPPARCALHSPGPRALASTDARGRGPKWTMFEPTVSRDLKALCQGK
jgi:hypothetical protein